MIDYRHVKLEQIARFIANHDCDMAVVDITDTHVVCETHVVYVDGRKAIEIDYVSTIRGAKRLLGY